MADDTKTLRDCLTTRNCITVVGLFKIHYLQLSICKYLFNRGDDMSLVKIRADLNFDSHLGFCAARTESATAIFAKIGFGERIWSEAAFRFHE